jgi:hypothetical protein
MEGSGGIEDAKQTTESNGRQHSIEHIHAAGSEVVDQLPGDFRYIYPDRRDASYDGAFRRTTPTQPPSSYHQLVSNPRDEVYSSTVVGGTDEVGTGTLEGSFPKSDGELVEQTCLWERLEAETMSPSGVVTEYSRVMEDEVMSSSGVVPERFRAGRESLSVIRNDTIRDSKRPKARAQDHDYRRRSSISPSMRIMPTTRDQYESPSREGVEVESFQRQIGPIASSTGGISRHESGGLAGSPARRENRHEQRTDATQSKFMLGGNRTTRMGYSNQARDHFLDPESFEINLTYQGTSGDTSHVCFATHGGGGIYFPSQRCRFSFAFIWNDTSHTFAFTSDLRSSASGPRSDGSDFQHYRES